MNDFKDLDLDYFAPRKPAEPEAKPEKTEVGDAPTADESAEPAERRRKPKPSRRELLNMRLSVLSVGVMVILFALMTLYLLLFPRSTVSQIENRNLAEFPKFSFASYFSGSFTADVATWFDDTVPNHDGFKNMSNSIKNLFGMKMFASTVTPRRPHPQTAPCQTIRICCNTPQGVCSRP